VNLSTLIIFYNSRSPRIRGTTFGTYRRADRHVCWARRAGRVETPFLVVDSHVAEAAFFRLKWSSRCTAIPRACPMLVHVSACGSAQLCTWNLWLGRVHRWRCGTTRGRPTESETTRAARSMGSRTARYDRDSNVPASFPKNKTYKNTNRWYI